MVEHKAMTDLPTLVEDEDGAAARALTEVREKFALWRHGLEFFTRTNVRFAWVIASYHSPLSITWSWGVGLKLGPGGIGWRRLVPFVHHYRTWILRVPYICNLILTTQRQMLDADYATRWRMARAAAKASKGTENGNG